MILLLILLSFTVINCFIPPQLINPLLSGSQLVIAKKGKEHLEDLRLNANTTRKIIHISTAPAFISTWGLYNQYDAKLWATSVPLFASFFLLYKGDELAEIISRSGNSKEIFKGPLLYTSILTILTYYYWIDNPIGIIAMIQLAIGDGFADIIGRKFGKIKWPYNNKKSIEGTLGFFITSIISTQLLVNNFYHYDFDFNKIIIISLVSSLVETFSNIDDNISIPLSVLLVNYLLTI